MMWRAEADVTQAEFDEAVGGSRQTSNAIDRGRYDPSLELAFALAGCFDTTIEDRFNPVEGEPRSNGAPGPRHFARPSLAGRRGPVARATDPVGVSAVEPPAAEVQGATGAEAEGTDEDLGDRPGLGDGNGIG